MRHDEVGILEHWFEFGPEVTEGWFVADIFPKQTVYALTIWIELLSGGPDESVVAGDDFTFIDYNNTKGAGRIAFGIGGFEINGNESCVFDSR